MNEAADFKSAVSTYSTTQALFNTHSKPVQELKRYILEARAGVEPTYTDLQSGAYPLCYRAP